MTYREFMTELNEDVLTIEKLAYLRGLHKGFAFAKDHPHQDSLDSAQSDIAQHINTTVYPGPTDENMTQIADSSGYLYRYNVVDRRFEELVDDYPGGLGRWQPCVNVPVEILDELELIESRDTMMF